MAVISRTYFLARPYPTKVMFVNFIQDLKVSIVNFIQDMKANLSL